MSNSTNELEGYKFLSQLGATLHTARDLHQATDWVTAAIRAAWNWDHCLIWYRNRPTNSFWVYESQGELETQFEETLEYTFTAKYVDHIMRVAETGTITIIHPVDDSIYANAQAAKSLSTVTTIVAVPLNYGDRTIGVVEFFLTEASLPDQLQIDQLNAAFKMLNEFVTQRQILNRARLLGRVAKASKALTETITEGINAKDIMQLATNSLRESFDYLHAIAWIKHENNDVTLLSQHGLLADLFTNISTPQDYGYPNENLEQTLQEGVLRVDNEPEERDWIHDLMLNEMGVISVISLPVIKNDNVIGAIECFLPYHLDEWDEEYFDAYTGLVNIMSMALNALD